MLALRGEGTTGGTIEAAADEGRDGDEVSPVLVPVDVEVGMKGWALMAEERRKGLEKALALAEGTLAEPPTLEAVPALTGSENVPRPVAKPEEIPEPTVLADQDVTGTEEPA